MFCVYVSSKVDGYTSSIIVFSPAEDDPNAKELCIDYIDKYQKVFKKLGLSAFIANR